MGPDDDQNDGNGKNQGGDGVDFGSDAAAQAAPDFQRESIVAADEEKGDGDFVHGEGEDEQAGGDEREFEIGQSDCARKFASGVAPRSREASSCARSIFWRPAKSSVVATEMSAVP